MPDESGHDILPLPLVTPIYAGYFKITRVYLPGKLSIAKEPPTTAINVLCIANP